MTTRKEIGKIDSVRFGFGGYDDAMIGISFTLSGRAWGCGDFWGDWSGSRSEQTQWTETDRLLNLGEIVMRLTNILTAAKAKSVEELKSKPIEATFDERTNRLLSWRILEEAL